MNLFSLATDGVDLDALPLEQSQQPRASFKFAEASEPARLRLPRELDDVFGFAAQEYGVDVDVLRGIAYAESRFNPDIISGKVKSPAGAIGLMQFMPKTAQEYGIDPTDPVQAIMGGAAYLRKSLDKFDGDYERAVASYNWGPNRKAYDSEDWASKAPQETQKYLMTVFGAVGKFKDGAAERGLPQGVTPSKAGAGRGVVNPGMVNTQETQAVAPPVQQPSRPASTDRTWGEVASDTSKSVAQGLLDVASLPGAAYSAATGDWDTGYMNAIRGTQEVLQEQKSPGMQAQQKALQDKLKTAEGWREKFAVGGIETVTNPALLVDTLARSAPGMLAGGLTGRVAGAGANALGNAAIGRTIATGSEAAARVALVAKNGAGAIARGVATGTAASQQGVSVANEVYGELSKLPPEAFSSEPEFAELSKQFGPEQAKDVLASAAANRALLMATGASVLSMKMVPGGSAIETMFLPSSLKGAAAKAVASTSLLTKPIGKGMAGGVVSKTVEMMVQGAKTGSMESVSEGVEEASGAGAKGLELSRAGQDVNLGEMMGEAGGQGAAAGFAMGKVAGMQEAYQAPRVESQPTTPQAPPVAPAAPAQSGTPPVAPTPPAAQGTADAIMELERRLQAAANPTAQPTADAGTTPVAPTGNAGATEGAGGTVAAAADGQPEQAQALSVPENFTATPAATVGTQTSVQAGPGFTGKGIAAEMAALRARSQPAPVATQPATQQAEQPRTTKAAQPAKANLDPQGLLSDDERQMLGEFTRLYQTDLKADIRQRLGMTPKEQATAQVEKKKPSALLSLIVQMGGIKSGLSADLTGANAMEGNRRHPGLFRNNGKQLDVLVQSLKERGYLTQADEDSILDNGGTNKLADMIQAELSGERAKLVDNTDGFEAMRDADMRQGMEDKATALGLSQDMVNSMSDSRLNGTIKRIEARLGHPIKTDFATRKMSRAEARAEREAILMADRYERARAKYDAELQAFAEADDMVQDAVLDVVVDEDGNVEIVYARAVEVAAASDALNGTWSDQNAEVDTRRVGAGQENSGQAGPPVASTAEAGAGNPEANRSEASAGSQETLTTYTPEEVTAQQEAAEKAERTAKAKKQADDLSAKKEQERKEIAQASVAAADTFELSQDAMANLTGQRDVFGAMEQEAKPTQPKATELTPKQFHEAKLAFIAADTGASMADVRENYDTEAGRAENNREWAGQVDLAANAGEALTRQTLDKLYELAPNVRLPETAIPQGYQRPEARRAEAEDKQARVDGRKAAKATTQMAKYNDEAKLYGYTVDASGAIFRGDKKLSPVVKESKGRLRVESPDGKLLFSGAQTGEAFGEFLKSFWNAEKAPAKAEPSSQFTDLEKELQAQSHATELDGDIGIVAGGGVVRYVSLEDAISAAKKAIESGVKDVPFQIHNATGIRIGDVDRVLEQVNRVDYSKRSVDWLRQNGGDTISVSDAIAALVEKQKAITGDVKNWTERDEKGHPVKGIALYNDSAAKKLDAISWAITNLMGHRKKHGDAPLNAAKAPDTDENKVPLSSVIDKVNAKNGQGLTDADLVPNQKPSFSRAKEQPRTPAATIRAAITKAYGNLLDKLEGKGLVTIAQTEREAIESAAQARADKTGGDVEQIKRSMLASVQMQRVWHGTPHRFDKFSTEFMGKGEGAQAFGWGLYYASKREIAESYRGTLTYRDMVRKFRNAMPDDASIEDASEWADSGDAPKDMARVIKALSADDWLGFDYPAQALTALFKEPANFDISNELADAAKAMQGQLYEVEIPEDGDMLLWDKPLSEQPKNVLAALRRGYEEQGGDYPDKSATPKTGREIYNDFRALAGGFESMDQRAASEYLASLGIKGIKYLDGTSRNAGDGSYNYVIFDGADTQIVDVKYSANGNIEGFFDKQTGKSFLVADNLTASSAPGTLMHEVGIHMAADGKLEPLFKRAAQLLKLNKNNPFLQRVQARMDQSGETSAEEAAAYIVTEYENENDRANAPASVAQWVKDFIADVRAWLFGKGVLLKADQLTVADIAAVARANAKSMAMGDSQGDVRNSKAPNVYEWADRESAPVGAWVKADYKLADSQPVYPGNSGQFDTATPDIRRSISNRAQQPLFNQTPAHTWEELGESYVDTKLYNWQDDRIDLKRVQESITKAGRQIDDQFDARTAETLLPGRLAKRTEDFMAVEAAPLLKDMAKNNVTMEEVSDYMLARHAPERNAQIAKVNPDMPDAGSGTNSEGVLMTTQAANDHIAALTTGKRMVLEMLARRVDAITKGTRDLLVAEGLEKAETIRAWEGAYKHYVPLFRDEAANTPGHPVGSGISVTGSSSKRATGSTKEVTNMLAHVLMQREAAITRAEKNRVGMSLYGMALSHPNKAFWSTVQPKMSTADIVAELQRMGVDPMDGIMGMDAAPTIRTVDDRTGLVVDRPNPMYKKLDNAIVVKVNGEDRVILFNTKNERAMRMAESLKNQHFDQGMWVNAANTVAPVTRFMSAMMTQYNPAFGMVNAVRDIQGALVNLTSTPLNGKQARVLADTPAAVIGIARDIRGDGKRTPWSDLWVQFQEDGGRTGYRDLVVSPYERAANMEKDIKRMQQEGKWTPGNAAHAVLDLLGDFNDSLENGVRLAAYKAALDKGMTRPQAAKLARELTVDFNRKGRKGRELGKLYAFLNASIQGNARNIATVMGAHGGKVLAGGFALGVLQALMLAAAGYEDDEIREFQKARALIIPIGGKQHITIPMALGFHVIPNTSRILTELMLTGGKDWQTKVPEAMFEIANAANPFGGGGDWKTAHGPLTMVMPTAGDWAVDLAMNRDFTGNQISRTRYNERNPGSAIARESTLRTPSGQVYQGISKAINDLTGGSDRKAGAVSPTPEELRYIMGVVGGGVYRETEKALNAAVMLASGDEIKATQVPLGSRFMSEVRDEDVQRSRYYKNSRKLEDLEADLKDAAKDRDSAKMNELRQDKLTNAIGLNNAVQRHITQINKMAKDDIGDKAAMAQHDANRAAAMRRLNDEVLKLEKQAQ